MSRVAVLIPTRERLPEFQRAVVSVRETSGAIVMAYIDEDEEPFRQLGKFPDVVVGPRLGCAASMNVLANEAIMTHPEVDTLVMMTDDAVMETPGWDEYLVSELDKFPGRIGAVSPFLSFDSGANRVDMPSISKELYQLLGWYAHPNFLHYFWPGVIDAVTEGMCLTHAPRERYSINHGNISPQRDKEFNFDALTFGKWYAWDKATLRAKVESAIAESR